MADYDLDPCPFCGCSRSKIICWSQKSLVAAQCRACGARGPVRPIMAANDADAVEALVADDWNVRMNRDDIQAILERVAAEEAAERTPPECHPKAEAINPAVHRLQAPPPSSKPSPPGDGGAGGTSTHIPAKEKSPRREQRASDIPPTAGGGAGTANTPMRAKKQSRPPGDGGGLGTTQKALADRLRAFFDTRDLTINQGVQMYDGILGASHYTLIKVVRMKPVLHKTLNAVSAALDRLENNTVPKEASVEDMKAADPAGEVGPGLSGFDESRIEKLANKFAPITRLTPLPRMDPPPRCGKVT